MGFVGARVLRLLGNSSDGAFKDVACASSHRAMLEAKQTLVGGSSRSAVASLAALRYVPGARRPATNDPLGSQRWTASRPNGAFT